MELFFAPASNVLMGSVAPAEQGIASGVNNALREMGSALAVAVLASVFAANGGYFPPAAFADGLRPACGTRGEPARGGGSRRLGTACGCWSSGE
jgi:hypothetical protein